MCGAVGCLPPLWEAVHIYVPFFASFLFLLILVVYEDVTTTGAGKKASNGLSEIGELICVLFTYCRQENAN